jgi:hypothetical protein
MLAGGCAGRDQAALAVDDGLKSGANGRVIVNDHDADHQSSP